MAGPETFAQGDPNNPFDAAAMRIQSTQADSRFTRTPISIENYDQNKPTNVTGAYDPGDAVISVNASGQPTYADLMNTISHEDIHSLLDDDHRHQVGVVPQAGARDPSSVVNYLGSMFAPPAEAAGRGFQEGKRSGVMGDELPAYVGAYKTGQLAGFTPEQRAQWMRMYTPSLDAARQRTMFRIMQAHDASQRK